MGLNIYWMQNQGGTGNVQWSVYTYCAAVGTQVYGNSIPWNTPSSGAFPVPAGNNLAVIPFGPLVQTGCAPYDILYVMLQNTASGSGLTTYTSSVNVFGVQLQVVQ